MRLKDFRVTLGGRTFIYRAQNEKTLRRRLGSGFKAFGGKITEVKK